MSIDDLSKATETIENKIVHGQPDKTQQTIGWIDHRCQEAVGAFYDGRLNVGQAITVLQDIHATIAQLRGGTK